MRSYTLDHLSDATLLSDLATLVATERHATAVLLAHLAEVDARELFKPTAYPSMFLYCTRVLRLAEAVAYKRIRAARIARQFPQILDAIADGRVHVTGVAMLAPHITAENVDELVTAATHRTKHELEGLIARLAPQPDVPTKIRRLPAPRAEAAQPALDPPPPAACELDPDPVPGPRHESQPAAEAVRPPSLRSARIKPLSPERFALQVTIGQATRDKLDRATALLRHANPSGDVAEVLDRALDALLADIEKNKFGKTPRPRAPKARAPGADPRCVPNHVRRTVHDRDEEQCTFVDEDGVRCTSRAFLEYDHRTPACYGGQPTVAGMGLLCRAHNQHEAERALGAGFMREKRAAARAARVAQKQPGRTLTPSATTAVARPDRAPEQLQLVPDASSGPNPGDADTMSTPKAARALADPSGSRGPRGSRCSEDLTGLYGSRRRAAWST